MEKIDLLDEYRNNINKIDLTILKLLEDRFILTKKIGLIKKQNNIPIYNEIVEKKILNKLTNSSKIDNEFIISIWQNIMNYSKNQQKEL